MEKNHVSHFSLRGHITIAHCGNRRHGPPECSLRSFEREGMAVEGGCWGGMLFGGFWFQTNWVC